MKTDEKNPQDWLFLARERLQAADALFQSLGITYSGVELLQESVERFLKAYLIRDGNCRRFIIFPPCWIMRLLSTAGSRPTQISAKI